MENQKGKQDTSNDYDDDASIEPQVPNSPVASVIPYFEHKVRTFYATREGENVTMKCEPKKIDGNYK